MSKTYDITFECQDCDATFTVVPFDFLILDDDHMTDYGEFKQCGADPTTDPTTDPTETTR